MEKTQEKNELLWTKHEHGDFNLLWIGLDSSSDKEISMVKWAEKFAYFIGADKFYRDDKGVISNRGGGKNSSEPVSTSQLRKFFGEVRRIQILSVSRYGKKIKKQEQELEKAKQVRAIEMLDPRLAYDAGRKKRTDKIGVLYQQLRIPLEKLAKGEGDFNRFVMVLEAIVAYHKLYYKEKNN